MKRSFKIREYSIIYTTGTTPGFDPTAYHKVDIFAPEGLRVSLFCIWDSVRAHWADGTEVEIGGEADRRLRALGFPTLEEIEEAHDDILQEEYENYSPEDDYADSQMGDASP